MNATPEGKRARRIGVLWTAAGGALAWAYLAMGPGFDVVAEVVVVTMAGTILGSMIGGWMLRRITLPHLRRRVFELAAEEMRRTAAD